MVTAGSQNEQPAGFAQAEEVEGASGTATRQILAGLNKGPVWADAANTRRTYETSWVAFSRWCIRRNLNSLPATSSTVAAYIADCSELVDQAGEHVYAASTFGVWITAIDARHRQAGLLPPGSSPFVRDMLGGLRRRTGERTRYMAPLLLADLKTALAHIDLGSSPSARIGHRDSAILLLGFVGAFRRAELSSIRVGDIALDPENGLLIRCDAFSTGTDGGEYRLLPFGADPLTCPPCAGVRWLRVLAAAERSGGRTGELTTGLDTSGHVCAGETDGLDRLDPTAWLFRAVRRGGHLGATPISADVVYTVVKRRLAAIGLDPRNYGSDSLRTGFIAQAMLDGASSAEIREQTGHRDAAYVERYRLRHAIPHGNAVTRLQL